MGLFDNNYNIEPDNWYKSFPYSFAFTPSRIGAPTLFIELPISPNNLTTNTHFATNVITTLYGVVEEHSEIRYYDIVISGNTGFAPRYTGKGTKTRDRLLDLSAGKKVVSRLATQNPTVGRESFAPGIASFLSIGGFLSEATNTAAAIAELAIETAQSVTGVLNFTGIKPEESGYVAFHNLYQFFLRYKNDTAPLPDTGLLSLSATLPARPSIPRQKHPLQFLNYKDGIAYDAIPLSFNLTRSAENPMLYQYNIRLRCYNLRSVEKTILPNDQDLLAELGLTGISGSFFSNITAVTNNAATLISGIAGAL